MGRSETRNTAAGDTVDESESRSRLRSWETYGNGARLTALAYRFAEGHTDIKGGRPHTRSTQMS